MESTLAAGTSHSGGWGIADQLDDLLGRTRAAGPVFHLRPDRKERIWLSDATAGQLSGLGEIAGRARAGGFGYRARREERPQAVSLAWSTAATASPYRLEW